jgi:quercetin dioxygenase-like cupin family protein
MTAALIKDLHHGVMADFADTDLPCRVWGIAGAALNINEPGTIFGFAWEGNMSILADGRVISVPQGDYFSIAGNDFEIGGGYGFLVHRLGYQGLNMVGGPVEDRGRLKYIDGCSDTLLIAPLLLGDPCFNLLHFPKGISQTAHTHPSIRAGLIHRGAGWCHTPDGSEELRAGKMFVLYPDAVHGFETRDESMTLTVFHPDSDFGPTHENHPMIRRTMVGGVSASDLTTIHTQEIAA